MEREARSRLRALGRLVKRRVQFYFRRWRRFVDGLRRQEGAIQKLRSLASRRLRGPFHKWVLSVLQHEWETTSVHHAEPIDDAPLSDGEDDLSYREVRNATTQTLEEATTQTLAVLEDSMTQTIIVNRDEKTTQTLALGEDDRRMTVVPMERREAILRAIDREQGVHRRGLIALAEELQAVVVAIQDVPLEVVPSKFDGFTDFDVAARSALDRALRSTAYADSNLLLSPAGEDCDAYLLNQLVSEPP